MEHPCFACAGVEHHPDLTGALLDFSIWFVKYRRHNRNLSDFKGFVVSKGMVFRRLVLMFSVAISGCGYSGDHALDNHQQESVTEVKQSVVKGDVYAPTERPVTLSFNSQTIQVLTEDARKHFEVLDDYAFALHQPGFFDDDGTFFFQNVTTDAILTAKFSDHTLYSFYTGTPIPKTDVTITQDHNWHGSNRLTLHVSKLSPAATISINPFTNLAYWLKTVDGARYATFADARDTVNSALSLPAHPFEVDLSTAQREFLKKRTITMESYSTVSIREQGALFCYRKLKDFTPCP
jgi:hypothetical protein